MHHLSLHLMFPLVNVPIVNVTWSRYVDVLSSVAGHCLCLPHLFPPPSHVPDVVGGLRASSAMLSPVVQTVLQMGFEASLVESLVQTKYLLSGQHYTSVSDLVTDVLQAEQEDRQRGLQSRGNRQWEDTSTYTQVWYLSIFLGYLYFT